MKLAALALAALAVTGAHARDFRSAEVHPMLVTYVPGFSMWLPRLLLG